MTKPIISFIVLILSLGFAFFFVKPEFDVVMKNRAGIVTLDKTLQKSEEIKRLIKDTSENLSGIDKDILSRFAVFLPEVIDDVRFANNLQNIGYLNGIILEDINVIRDTSTVSEDSALTKSTLGVILSRTISVDSSVESKKINTAVGGTLAKKYKTTKANFSLTSSYSTFLLFLDDLEKSLSLVNITSLSFTPVKEVSVSRQNDLRDTILRDRKKDTGAILYRYIVDIETYSLK